MGNANSMSKDSALTTWAVAQYTSISREQLLDLRDACFQQQQRRGGGGGRRQQQEQQENKENEIHEGKETSRTTFGGKDSTANHNLRSAKVKVLSRSRLEQCLQSAGIKTLPDGEIICDLHTMWDENDSDDIPTMAFLISLCPLACDSAYTSRTFFQFVMEFHDVQETRRLSPMDLIMILESLNKTIFFLGDEALDGSQIKQIVLEIVQSMSIVHNHAAGKDFLLPLDDVVTMLAVDPSIRKLLAQKLKTKHRVSFAPHVSIAVMGEWLFSTDDDEDDDHDDTHNHNDDDIDGTGCHSNYDDLVDYYDGFLTMDLSSITDEAGRGSMSPSSYRNGCNSISASSYYGEDAMGGLFSSAPRPSKAQLKELANDDLLNTMASEAPSPASSSVLAAAAAVRANRKSTLNAFLFTPKVRATVSSVLTSSRLVRMPKAASASSSSARKIVSHGSDDRCHYNDPAAVIASADEVEL